MTTHNVTPFESKITLSQFLQQTAHRLWHGNHRIRNLKKLSHFCQFGNNKDRNLADFNALHIYDFVGYLEHDRYNRKTGEHGLGNNSVNRYISAISSVFRYAQELGYIPQAPRIRYKRVESGRARYFTQNEIDQLKQFFRTSGYPAMVHFTTLALNTGMRKSEILGLNQTPQSLPDDVSTWGEIQVKEGSVYAKLRETKTGVPRSVPLNKEARRALGALDGLPLKHYDHHKFYCFWNRARELIAPGDKEFVFYVCRHTFATSLVHDHKVHDLQLQTLMGHKSLMTTKRYCHPKDEANAQTLDALSF